MRTFTIFMAVGLFFSTVYTQTNVSGSITKDSIWTRTGSPYIVNGSVTVNNPFKLTVDSGVVVQFTAGANLYVNGILQARRATFTSRKDTVGGSPNKGDWASINFGGGASSVTLDTCQVKYGGGTAMINGSVGTAMLRNCSILNSSTWGISLTSTTITLLNNTISNSTAGGLYVSSTTGTLTNCTVSSSGNNGIQINGGTNMLTNCTITGSGGQGVYIQSGSVAFIGCIISTATNAGIYFEQNSTITLASTSISSTDWPLWYNGQSSLIFNGSNTLTGNTHNGIYMNFYGTNADFVLDTVAIPYVFPYDFTINSGHTMTISSNDVLKFAGVHLFVNGTLKSIAGAGQYIYFTSYKDDNLPTPGSDTNNDGIATVPHSGDWYGVVFNDASIDAACVMRRSKVSFAGAGNTGGITMYNASPTIDSCDMSNNYFGVMMQYVSNPVFTNNTIGSSQLVPIAMAFTASPVFSNNTFSNSDNQYDAIGLLGGTLTANAVLPIRKVVRIVLGTPDSISNVTYLLLDQVTVPLGMTMTINKGVVIKGYSNYQRFIVQGKFIANSTPDSLIVFTSAKDDNFGHPNDSNKDGNSTIPARGDWGGITFESGSDTTSIIHNCEIHYGAMPAAYYYNGIYLSGGAITTINLAKPTISNCVIDQVVYGVYAYGNSRPVITNTKIVNSQYTPIAMSIPADPVMVADTFINSGWTAIGIIGENLGASGTVRQRTVSGYTNITYVLLSDLTINSGTNVTINGGIVIKTNGAGIYVNGGLRVKGTIVDGNVVFTSIKDDNYGHPGDSNRDGNATSPTAGDWSTIRFQATSDDAFSLIDSCIINYAGNSSWGAVTFTDAGCTLSNSTIFKSASYGIRCENSSTPTVRNVTISGCTSDPIAMSLQSNPTFTDPITFSANGSQGIRILDATLSSNATLAQRSFAGITNIAYIMDNLTVNPGAVFTILPGVVIKFSNYYNGILVNGALVAVGTSTQKIIFTSLKDDSKGGDTNNDGNGSSPSKANWNSIDFAASSTDTLNSMKNCEFRYGGGYNYSQEYGCVRVYNATLKLDSSVISQSYSSAIGVFGSGHPLISNIQIDNITYTPVTISMFSNPTFSNMSALNVGYMAIGIKPETYSITATIPIRNFAGYSNITYLLYGTNTINTGTTITIPAGVVIKDGNWIVNGALATNGTSSQKVVFTDSRDDTFGNPGDTNGDGSATSPTISGIQRVTFNDVSIDSASQMKYAVFRYTDGGIYLNQASPKILDCTFDSDNWGVYLTGVSNPSIDSSSFKNLTYAPMRISLVSYPTSTSGNSISGTTYKAIGVLDGETLVQDVTLTKKSFAGINNIPYVFSNYTIANNSVLTIAPGVILKFFPLTGLTVRKGLIAEGKSHPDSTIVFTDLRDDFYGNDTNSDSTLSNPTNGANGYYYAGWNGINFTSESLAPFSRIRNAVIRFAGLTYSSAAITTNNASPSITYTAITNNYSAIIANGSSNPIVNYCDIDQNTQWGINNVNKSFTINAENNWWGSNTGPTHSGNPGGTGQPVTDAVDYVPFRTSSAQVPITGDVSLNGQVQAFDASLILKWIVDSGTNPLNALQQQVADVSGDGSILSFDASLILQLVAGKISIFPVEFMRKVSPGSSSQTPFAVYSTAAASVSLSEGQADHGKDVTIVLSGRDLKNLFSTDIVLTYNKDQLTPLSVNPIGIAAGSMTASSMRDGAIRIELASANALTGSGDLFKITFQVADAVKGKIASPVAFSKFIVNEIDMKSQTTDGNVAISGLPSAFGLNQNYPNPFNPSTTISYQVPDDGKNVKIDIYNITGQLVRTLVDGTHSAGEFKVVWDGTNGQGQQVSSGVYFFRMSSVGFVNTKKMLLMK